MDCFRFENMDIWKDAISISDLPFDYADKAEEKRFYKFAELFRASTMLLAHTLCPLRGVVGSLRFWVQPLSPTSQIIKIMSCTIKVINILLSPYYGLYYAKMLTQ